MSKISMTLGQDTIGEEHILSGSLYTAQSIDGRELEVDALNTRLDLAGYRGTYLAPSDGDKLLTSDGAALTCLPMIRVLVGDPARYHYGEEVRLYRGSAMMGKYYMSSLTRVGPTQYAIKCVGAIGLLDRSRHFGGVYRGITVPELMAEIIGGLIPYTVGPEYAKQKVYGHLPVASRRDNLHQLLFAIGAAVTQDERGDPLFSPFQAASYQPIPEDRVFLGGQIHYPQEITGVSVAEHSFAIINAEKLENLLDGPVVEEEVESPQGKLYQGGIVIFRMPCDPKSLTVEGSTILERGVNYAVLSPSGAAKLQGRPYVHTIRQVNYPPKSAAEAGLGRENRVSVDKATLVSYANAESVAKRVYNYCKNARSLRVDLQVEEEHSGSAVELTDPFGDKAQGLIRSMDLGLSHLLRASTEIVCGYTPEKPGNYYTNCVVLTKDGDWTVPPEAKDKIRVALIGGGEGGSSGLPGKDSRSGSSYSANKMQGRYPGYGGAGGKAGLGGRGGKVHVISLEVKPGDTFSVTIGLGGKGGARCSGNTANAGSLGTDTTFGSHSSALGSYTSGYSEDSSGEVFGERGEDGIAGGSGSGWDGRENFPQTYSSGSTVVGPDGTRYGPGSDATSYHHECQSPDGYHNAGYGGGCGGGAAVGRNGNSGTTNGSDSAGSYLLSATGAPGGSGATPIKPPAHPGCYGRGGDGGHGGGGGGGGGWAEINWAETATLKPPRNRSVNHAPLASGGSGGEAGDGEPGCVVIYY